MYVYVYICLCIHAFVNFTLCTMQWVCAIIRVSCYVIYMCSYLYMHVCALCVCMCYISILCYMLSIRVCGIYVTCVISIYMYVCMYVLYEYVPLCYMLSMHVCVLSVCMREREGGRKEKGEGRERPFFNNFSYSILYYY